MVHLTDIRIFEKFSATFVGTLTAFRHVYEDPIITSRQPAASYEERMLGQNRARELSRITSLFILRRTQDVNNKYLPPRGLLLCCCSVLWFVGIYIQDRQVYSVFIYVCDNICIKWVIRKLIGIIPKLSQLGLAMLVQWQTAVVLKFSWLWTAYYYLNSSGRTSAHSFSVAAGAVHLSSLLVSSALSYQTSYTYSTDTSNQ